ncbi:MAG: serine/threonine-protein kinase [Hyphomicrobium sp.]
MTNLVALQSGTELAGDYRIDRVLGAGGFGITYLADEIALNRLVTIKEYFPSDFAARTAGFDAAPRSEQCASDYRWGLDRFIEEAQTLAKFSHPNIVRVYRYFRANNTGYMVLHFEEGQSLKAWLKSLGRAPRQKELDQIVAPLLDALDSIHRSDFLHRDIAPDNIIIRKDGQPVLIDFGSARGEIAAHSKTVSALVKPGYSPYEQYAETSRQQGAWTDIYALGATLYHAVTGKRPPDSPSRMVKDEMIPAREAAVGGYRASFLKAIDKSLALSVDARPQSVAEWRGALLAPEPTPAPAPAAGGWFSRTSGRKAKHDEPAPNPSLAHAPPPPDAPGPQGRMLDFLEGLQPRKSPEPAKAAVVDAIAAAVAAEPAKAAASTVKLDAPPPPFIKPQKAAPAAPKAPPAAAPAAQKAGVSAPKAGAPASKAKAKSEPPSKANGELIKIAAPAGPRKPPVPRSTRFVAGRSWRPLLFKGLIGLGVASGIIAMQNRLPRMEMRGATVVASHQSAPVNALPLGEIKAHTGAASQLAFTADGRTLVTTGADATLKVWDATSLSLERTIELDDGPATSLAVSGTRALTGHANGQTVLWDTGTAAKISTFKRNDAEIWAVTFLGQGDRFASASHDWKTAIWDTASSTPAHIIDAHESAVQAVTFALTPRGPLLVTGGADKSVKLWKGDTFELTRRYTGHSDFVTTLAIAPDGRSIASAGLDGNIRIWSTQSRSTRQRLYGHKGRVGGLAFSPSGAWLASAGEDGKVRLWDLKKGRTARVLPGSLSRQTAVTFSPDGQKIAAAGEDGIVRFWAAPAHAIATQ